MSELCVYRIDKYSRTNNLVFLTFATTSLLSLAQQTSCAFWQNRFARIGFTHTCKTQPRKLKAFSVHVSLVSLSVSYLL